MNTNLNSTERFSDRVQDYVHFRPSYPNAVIETLQKDFGLNKSHVVADIGSGTGISSELFLKNGNAVYAVEPNAAMREAAEKHLASFQGFHSVTGIAEATTLPDQIADVIVAAQAFHWFSPQPTKLEFQRILKEKGLVVILFNDRDTVGSPFAAHYEALLQEFGTDYKEVKHKNAYEQRHKQFLGEFKEYRFPNPQHFDFQGPLGRLKSSSYVPKENAPSFQPMVQKLREIFDQNQVDGRVTMGHITKLFCSRW